jgi:hypothetical protein
VALVVNGRVRHRQMQPDKVQAVLRKHLPGLQVSGLDFSVELRSCSVGFFCNASSLLDYTVTAKAGNRPPPAVVAALARETDGLNDVLRKALTRRPFRRARVEFCLIEDERSSSSLLHWTKERPLSSRPAKLSYGLCVALLVLAAVLVHNALHQQPGPDRSNNITALLLAICLPAALLPLPFLFEALKVRGTGRWVFSQTGEGSS